MRFRCEVVRYYFRYIWLFIGCYGSGVDVYKVVFLYVI